MLYSQLFGKTKKQYPADETSKNAQLLIKGGFIQKEMAGVYVFLPLGYRVLQKIIQIIREEMNAIGAQEVLMSSLQNPELWEKTDRWDDEVIDVWFKSELKNGSAIGLATTHEEPLTQLVSKYVQSYNDLPVYLYQFQTKFRNELRARSGVLRTREFIMKDLYSFNTTEEELDKFYEEAKKAYVKIFDRLGIGKHTYLTFASGGSFSKYSHEFQAVCAAGEDTIYLSREKGIAINKEVYEDEVLAALDLKKDTLEEVLAIEVGNIFKLKTKYSDPLNLKYTDTQGQEQTVYMGSYGIGPARNMATIVELFNDEKGIVWPASVAPFKAHLIGLNLEDSETSEKAQHIYNTLMHRGVEVLFDDRTDIGAGEKFADCDLIGCPFRLVVSKKTGDSVELKLRSGDTSELRTLDEILNILI